tara:strand:- start:156 stop:878 length:723 start_codon:yes stop_codon:yes gene_type:complete
MAFGFLGDIVEGIGDVILGPSGGGQRGARIGTAVGAAVGGPTGAAYGSAIGSQLSSSIGGGSPGQEATSTPTYSQAAITAPESAMSGDGYPMTYRPMYTAGFTPRLPSPTVRDMGTAGAGAMADTILDIALPNFFEDPCMKKMPKLIGMTKDGCPTVTRKQQRVLRQMAQYMPLENVAYEANVDTTTMARLISKSFPPRSRGISGAQLRTANRVNNKILSMAGKLGYNVTPKTKAQLGCK